jgi:hypothetical protein
MRNALFGAFLLLISAGICWGQTPLTEIYFDNFMMVPGFGSPTVLDDFELGTNNWWDPDGSGSTYGTFYDAGEDWSTNSTTFGKDSLTVYDGLYSARLTYQWAHPDSNGLIREYPGSGDPQNIEFTSFDKLEVWLYGNASGDLFRFVVDDHGDIGGAHEASEWIPIDWTGWQLVSWDLSADSVVAWFNGNGILEGPVSFDSFQIEKSMATGVEIDHAEPHVPTSYALSQNYPNPFNAETRIRFAIPEAGPVSLRIFNVTGQLVKTLVDEQMPAGSHHAVWNGMDERGTMLASGVYFCRMEAGAYSETIKMSFLR